MQVENEYGFYEGAYGDAGKAYASWAANMAVSLNTGVPWIMCQQWDTPETVVSDSSLYCASLCHLSIYSHLFICMLWHSGIAT